MTAHKRGACVVAVYTKDVAEAKATNATDAGGRKGYPLLFTTSRRNRRASGVRRTHADPAGASPDRHVSICETGHYHI